MKVIFTSLFLLISFSSIAKQVKDSNQPQSVKCIKKELKKNKSLEKAYQICSLKK